MNQFFKSYLMGKLEKAINRAFRSVQKRAKKTATPLDDNLLAGLKSELLKELERRL